MRQNNGLRPHRRALRGIAAPAAAAMALVLSACATSSSGGGGSSDGVDVSGAAKAAAAGREVPGFELEAPAIEAKGIAGKTVFVVPLSSEIPYVAAVDKEIKSVVEDHGGRYVEFANSGQPTQWAAGINQAVATKADVIILSQGPDPKLLVPQLRGAKAAGIPVVLSHLYSVGEDLPAEVADLVHATTNVDFAEAGRLMVDAAIDESEGAIHALVLTSNEVAPSRTITKAIKDQVQKRCPSACSVEVSNVPLVDWATKLSTTTQTTLQRNPKVNWVLPLYDSMSPGVIAGINSAGKTQSVSVASYNGTPDILKLIQDDGPMKVNVGESTAWLGRAAADQAFRALLGEEPVADGDVKTPLRIFTEDNVDEAGTPPNPTDGYGDAYVSGYDRLWGSGS